MYNVGECSLQHDGIKDCGPFKWTNRPLLHRFHEMTNALIHFLHRKKVSKFSGVKQKMAKILTIIVNPHRKLVLHM